MISLDKLVNWLERREGCLFQSLEHRRRNCVAKQTLSGLSLRLKN